MMKTRFVLGSFSAWYILEDTHTAGRGAAVESRKDGGNVTGTHAHSRYKKPAVYASFRCEETEINPHT